MGRVPRLVVAAALALALGGWTSPHQLETGPVRGAALEGDGNGHRVAAWFTDTDVRVALADRGRDFGPARTLAPAGKGRLQLAVGPRGDALVVWVDWTSGYVPETGEGCCLIVRGALLSRNGRVTGPVTLTNTASRPATNSFNVVIGAGSRGRFGVVWSSPDPQSRFLRLASIRRGFGALEWVPGGGLTRLISFDSAQVRLLSVGDSAGLQEASRNEAGHWSSPRSLLGQVLDGLFGTDARGQQVGFMMEDGPTEIGVRAPPGPLVHNVLVPGGDPAARIVPYLDVAWSGAAVLAWEDFFAPPSDGGAMRVRIRRPGRPFGPVDLVYQAPSSGTVMRDVAVAPDGSVAIALDAYPSAEQPVVMVRPDGSVRNAGGVRTRAPLFISDVLADSRGAATLLQPRSSEPGLWASRAH